LYSYNLFTVSITKCKNKSFHPFVVARVQNLKEGGFVLRPIIKIMLSPFIVNPV
jgi:hypothetical protein